MAKLATAIMTGLLGLPPQVHAQPCPWQQTNGADEIGASATQTPKKALEGLSHVEFGKVYALAHVYDEAILPKPFERKFDVTNVPFDPEETPSQAFNEGFFEGSLGQVGTQLDALGHAGHDSYGFYNCLSQQALGPDDLGRLQKLDAASVQPFFTRAVLLDFVGHSGVPKIAVDGSSIVADSYVITMADVDEVLRNEGVTAPGEGDVVLFYTGWDSIFGRDNDRLLFSPGPGIEVADWLASRRVALVGADTMAVEALSDGVSPELLSEPSKLGEDLGNVLNAVHLILLTKHGIHLLENMRLGHLAADLRDAAVNETSGGSPYEFLFVFAPVPIAGMADSPGQPLAVR